MKPELIQFLVDLGNRLKFDARTEVGATEGAFVDVVWFDTRLPIPADTRTFNMRYQPFFPMVGFEVELHTALNAKHVKGSVSNLSNLGAQLGVIVVGKGNFDDMRKKPNFVGINDKELKPTLRDRVYRWVYAEAQPKGRIVVMFEDEVRDWASRMILGKPATVPSLDDIQNEPSPAGP